ncbi:hypothetical protein LTR10_023037 [Elasticomyces elasticus]|uniref:Major facilitator superfamily (MFS) profile domain-containing protein n=1 Tax=Exophiala sideris TaxID=1016849 RepID=A0ABR0IVA3_9EURO|nr:hypothetical protein LTR10_023037 [Elasticomyces elasticus]KAK5021041.1 hypothetical protein LTS07_011296 [Exophiala sideris]KAK5023318.1 hypothetical protein LTR13_011230 [Exophiala sideris]KAK5048767.1 hypothetical protein LTR69_011313 [Exophiala sideris]KAK5176169.1 hypothetical protein LTR44_011264 [Eurotiomycetes sp. CCFEE 6388]
MGWMCDARGRKQALWIAATISLVGSALQAGSAAIGMFLFARWLTGYGVVVLRGSKDEAWTIIAKLHYNPADPEELYARREFDQMCRQVENDRLYFEHESVVDLFRKPSYRKRMICGFLTFFSNESSGILVIYNYSVLIYKGLGQTGYMPLLLSGVYVTLGAMGNWVNSMLVDRVGRKALFLIGLSGMLVSLIAETALVRFYAGTVGHGGLSAAVFFIFLHLVFYGCCIDANSFVYCSEIFPTHIRPQGMAWSVGTLFLTTIPYLEAAPTAFATIGYRYYIVFIILTAINIPIIYFFFPETKGLSLEEIGEKFGDDVAIHLTNQVKDDKKEIEANMSAFETVRDP